MLIALINFVSKKLVTIYKSQGNLTEESKAVPLHAMVALGGEEVLLLLILDLGTR
jgi:hypothetical protein